MKNKHKIEAGWVGGTATRGPSGYANGEDVGSGDDVVSLTIHTVVSAGYSWGEEAGGRTPLPPTRSGGRWGEGPGLCSQSASIVCKNIILFIVKI